MTLDELRHQRARDMTAVIDRQHGVSMPEFPGAELRACSARELEWLAPQIALRQNAVARAGTAPHATTGVVSPYTPSMVVVTYTARYFVSNRSQHSRGTAQDVYLVYGALQATLLPTARGIGEL